MNEILPSGQVVHLDDLKAPKPMKRQELPYGGAISAPANPTSNTAQAPLKQDTSTNQQEQKTETFPDKVNGGTTGGPLSPQVNLDAECEQNTTSKASTDSVITPQKITAPPGMAAQDATPPQIPTPDLHKDEPKKLAPHLRIPPPSPSVPLSMRDLDGTESATNSEQKKRKKETVLIRQTAEGWVEVDEAKEKELKEEDAAGDGAAGIEPGLDATETPIQQEPEIEEKSAMGPPPIPSTQAQWQAFAGPPTGFQVSSLLNIP